MILVFQVVKNFNKEYKHTLWEKIKNNVLDVVIYIFEANTSLDKKPILQNIKDKIETIKILIRITRDLKITSLSKIWEIILLIDSISKQLNGWIKYENSKQ